MRAAPAATTAAAATALLLVLAALTHGTLLVAASGLRDSDPFTPPRRTAPATGRELRRMPATTTMPWEKYLDPSKMSPEQLKYCRQQQQPSSNKRAPSTYFGHIAVPGDVCKLIVQHLDRPSDVQAMSHASTNLNLALEDDPLRRVAAEFTRAFSSTDTGEFVLRVKAAAELHAKLQRSNPDIQPVSFAKVVEGIDQQIALSNLAKFVELGLFSLCRKNTLVLSVKNIVQALQAGADVNVDAFIRGYLGHELIDIDDTWSADLLEYFVRKDLYVSRFPWTTRTLRLLGCAKLVVSHQDKSASNDVLQAVLKKKSDPNDTFEHDLLEVAMPDLKHLPTFDLEQGVASCLKQTPSLLSVMSQIGQEASVSAHKLLSHLIALRAIRLDDLWWSLDVLNYDNELSLGEIYSEIEKVLYNVDQGHKLLQTRPKDHLLAWSVQRPILLRLLDEDRIFELHAVIEVLLRIEADDQCDQNAVGLISEAMANLFVLKKQLSGLEGKKKRRTLFGRRKKSKKPNEEYDAAAKQVRAVINDVATLLK